MPMIERRGREKGNRRRIRLWLRGGWRVVEAITYWSPSLLELEYFSDVLVLDTSNWL